MLGGVGIVWVHLDGKVLCSVKELDEQRESVSLRCAKELVVLRPQAREKHPRVRAVPHVAVSGRMCRYGPALSDGPVGYGVAKFCLELAPSPDLLVEDGLDTYEVHFGTQRASSAKWIVTHIQSFLVAVACVGCCYSLS